MKKIFLLIVSIVILSLKFGVSDSFACSCVMPAAPAEALENSTSVFTGRVEWISDWKQIEPIDEDAIFPSMRSGSDVEFTVSQVFKWESTASKTIYTASSSATCGYSFEQWEEYIVYTYWEAWDEQVSLCSRTSLLADASWDVRILSDQAEVNQVNQPESNQDDSIEPEVVNYPTKPSNTSLYILLALIVLIWAWFYISSRDTKSK